uniref:Uncharacterized protein n=1 Tax=Capsicum annuum var. glabriusculum TaxID=165789 RepID=A0A5P9S2F3_CAPAN|nr:hypothetical protein [Capsicum annuum var. glabriusculum]
MRIKLSFIASCAALPGLIEVKEYRSSFSPLLGALSIPGVEVEEDDADETDCGGVKNCSLSESVSEDAWPIRESDGEAGSESVSEDAWPIRESDGEAGVAGDSELDAPDVPSPKGIIIWVNSSPVSSARKAKPTLKASPAEQQQPNPLRGKDRARPPRENPTFESKA